MLPVLLRCSASKSENNVKRLKFYCNLYVTHNESVRDLFVLFGQMEFDRLLRKQILKIQAMFVYGNIV